MEGGRLRRLYSKNCRAYGLRRYRRTVKIISGGQTGVDRAALDAAMKHGIDCGGWVPAGRLDEFGRIPDRYPVVELQNATFADRTRQNIRESDGTVIIYSGELVGGTQETAHFCEEKGQAHRLIDGNAQLQGRCGKDDRGVCSHLRHRGAQCSRTPSK